MSTATTIKSIELDGARLVERLGGVWRRGGGMCHCPAHPDRRPSLSVRAGRSTLLFKCFAGCDTIDVLRALRALDSYIPKYSALGQDREPTGPLAAMASRALDLWENALPLAGTLGESYLARRGLTAGSPALRFHPRTPLGSGRAVQFRPALIAAIEDKGRILAVQRIFVDGGSLKLAAGLSKPKMTLGRPLAGAVRLFPPEETLGLAEGVETALAASILLGLPVWATLGNERLPRISLPQRIDRLLLLLDADRAGRLAASRARAAFAREGRTIETRWPWGGLNDWNDVLLCPNLWEGRLGEAGCG